ncbi:sensor histidine kinase [Microbacterium sp. NPDC091313]
MTAPSSVRRATQPGPELRRFGPGWPVRAASDGPDPAASFPHVLWSRGSVSWYIGAAFSLLWLINIGAGVVEASTGAFSAATGLAIVVVFGAAFLVAAPVAWTLSIRGRLLVCAGLLALSFALLPWLGGDVVGTWTYVGVIVGMSVLPWRVTWIAIALLAALALVSEIAQAGEWTEGVLFFPAIVLSISMMMAAFARTLASANQLQATQEQMALLAAERERDRVARDIHDILGHTLTVLTVKAELAGRLVEADPARAVAEIGEVESLARGALADVRATVAGFRGVTVSGEIAAARAALAAAGIAADLPGTTEAVPGERRELAGWVVREGVTNVIRHSGATRCRVGLDARGVEVCDDGAGPRSSAETSTGLTGLRERAEASGARLSLGRSDLGGFRLAVRW